MGLGEKDHTDTVPFISYYIKCILSALFMPVDVDSDHLAEVAFAKFLNLYSPFNVIVFGRKSPCAAHT